MPCIQGGRRFDTFKYVCKNVPFSMYFVIFSYAEYFGASTDKEKFMSTTKCSQLLNVPFSMYFVIFSYVEYFGASTDKEKLLSTTKCSQLLHFVNK